MGRPPIKKPSRRNPSITLGRIFDKKADKKSRQRIERKEKKYKPKWRFGEEE